MCRESLKKIVGHIFKGAQKMLLMAMVENVATWYGFPLSYTFLVFPYHTLSLLTKEKQTIGEII